MMHEMTDEDAAVTLQSLLMWQKNGVEDPILPAYGDADGDGEVDYWGLTGAGKLERRGNGLRGTNVALKFGEEDADG